MGVVVSVWEVHFILELMWINFRILDNGGGGMHFLSAYLCISFVPSCFLFFLSVPSLPPGNVSRDPIGDNMVRVSWTPPTDVTQYVVTYSSSLDNNTITINSGTTTSVTLENITVGVAYDITVQANGDIPGPISAPVSITLTGRDGRPQ